MPVRASGMAPFRRSAIGSWRPPSSADTGPRRIWRSTPSRPRPCLIFRLAREGSGSSGPMGIKSIATHLNASGIRTRDGGKWGIDAVHKVLTRTTYVGRHRFNTKFWKTRERKPETEIVEMAVPAIVDKDEFEAVQALLKSRSPAMVAPRIVSGPTLLTGICFCAGCGGAMTLRTGKSGRYRYYTCCTKARQGETGCPGRTVPMEKLDNLVAEYIEQDRKST